MEQYRQGGRTPFEPPAPKPYNMVPLLNRVDRKAPTGHDRYHPSGITGKIEGTLQALSPIHIGSGVVEPGQETPLIKTAVRTGGQIVIPGSSLKGAIRSVVEAITESCICKISRELQRAIPGYMRECWQRNRLCIACRMFGAMGFQGNVSIHDAPQFEGNAVTLCIPELYAPSIRRRAYFDESRDVAGRKFYMHGQVATGETPVEACEVGSKFRFSVQADNLGEAEWGLLFIAIGGHADFPFKLKIGGAKPVCFGSIDLRIEQIHTAATPKERYLNWGETAGTVIADDLLNRWQAACIQSAMDAFVKPPQLTQLAEILRYPNDRSCPATMY